MQIKHTHKRAYASNEWLHVGNSSFEILHFSIESLIDFDFCSIKLLFYHNFIHPIFFCSTYSPANKNEPFRIYIGNTNNIGQMRLCQAQGMILLNVWR